MLTPGRYVGAAELEEDDEPFEQKMARLTKELEAQFEESDRLQKVIKNNLSKLTNADISSWQEITINDLGKVVTGKTPSTSNLAYFGGDIPFVTPTDMNDRRFISKTERYLTKQGADVVKGSQISAGTVMASCIGSQMGKVAIAGKQCVTNQQINSIIVSPEYSELFVYYSLSLREDEIRTIGSGSAVPILNKTDFSNLTIVIPPLPEQRAIAAILGALDDKIEINRCMNGTLESMAGRCSIIGL